MTSTVQSTSSASPSGSGSVALVERALWRMAGGRATDDDRAVIEAEPHQALVLLDRLIVAAEDDIDSVRHLRGPEREQVLADFVDTLQQLRAVAATLRPDLADSLSRPVELEPAPPAVVADSGEFDDLRYEELVPVVAQLQATWSAGHVVVWAGGRGATPDTFELLTERLAAVGGPPIGWLVHKEVPLPGGQRAAAQSISMRDALGWLVAVGVGGTAPNAVVRGSDPWFCPLWGARTLTARNGGSGRMWGCSPAAVPG